MDWTVKRKGWWCGAKPSEDYKSSDYCHRLWKKIIFSLQVFFFFKVCQLFGSQPVGLIQRLRLVQDWSRREYTGEDPNLIFIYTFNWLFLIMYKKIIIEEISDIFLDLLFVIMCLTNIKNIGDISYPRIGIIFITKQIIFYLKIDLLEKLIIILFFKGFKKINYINMVMLTFLIGVSIQRWLDVFSFLCLCFWSLGSSALIRCQKCYLLYGFHVWGTNEFTIWCIWDFGDYDIMMFETLFLLRLFIFMMIYACFWLMMMYHL